MEKKSQRRLYIRGCILYLRDWFWSTDFPTSTLPKVIEDTITSVVQRKNVCLVLPSLHHTVGNPPHYTGIWQRYCEAFKDAFGTVKVTRTAVIVPRVAGALRLWVPYGNVAMKGGKPVQPMDWEPNRRGFILISPYYTKKELRRLV